MATTSYMKIIRVTQCVDPSSGFFALTSPELPGLFLAGKDLAGLYADVPEVIKALYKLDCGEDVLVTMLYNKVEPAKKARFIPIPSEFALQRAA